MRKVLLQLYVSLDGYISGPNKEQEWIFEYADETCSQYADELLNSSDIILLGRILSKVFLDYWPTDSTEFGQKINRLPKIIFSKNLTTVEWLDVRIVRDIEKEIRELKNQPGKNLILYGGASIAQTFMKLGLIDEYHLFVVPVLLGSGLSLFKNVGGTIKLKLVKTTTSKSGVVIFHYIPEIK
jgi:dihydrofolate reductase